MSEIVKADAICCGARAAAMAIMVAVLVGQHAQKSAANLLGIAMGELRSRGLLS